MIGTGWEGDWERFVISQSVSRFLCAVLLFIHHPSVCVYLVQKQDKAAAQLLFVETLKISPNLAQISLRTLVNTLLVFASRIYQLSLNTRPVNPHTHTQTHVDTVQLDYVVTLVHSVLFRDQLEPAGSTSSPRRSPPHTHTHHRSPSFTSVFTCSPPSLSPPASSPTSTSWIDSLLKHKRLGEACLPFHRSG